MSRMNAILASGTAPGIVHMSAYANNLNPIMGDIFAAVNVVSREMVGFIPSVTRNAALERAAVGQTVTYLTGVSTQGGDVVPAMSVPEPLDAGVEVGMMAITKARQHNFGFTGEEQRAVNAGGMVDTLTIQGMWIADAIRKLANEVEADIAGVAAAAASRATGEAGTTPFATDDLSSIAQLRKILNDNGAPTTTRSLILNSEASANLISTKNLTRVNEAGTTMTLRDGELMPVHGFSIKETGHAVYHDGGTAASVTTNAAGYDVGDTVITVTGGTGSMVAGDVVQFAGDTNKYVLASAAGATITLQKPGLRLAIPAAATAITVSGDYAANVGFTADAIQAAFRPPASPTQGDLALDRQIVVDPRSGIPFEISIWPGYRKIRGEVALAWGAHATKPEHIALLLG